MGPTLKTSKKPYFIGVIILLIACCFIFGWNILVPVNALVTLFVLVGLIMYVAEDFYHLAREFSWDQVTKKDLTIICIILLALLVLKSQ